MSAKRFNFNFKANLKSGFQKASLIDDALAVISPLLYTLLPTFLGLSGWTGIAVGFSVPYLIGKALNVPSMCHSVIGIAAQHIMYVKGGKIINDTIGKPIWSFGDTANSLSPAEPLALPTNPIVSRDGLRDYQMIDAGGQRFMAYNPDDIASQAQLVPEPIGTTSINDIIQPQTGNSSLSDIAWGGSSRRSKQGWRV